MQNLINCTDSQKLVQTMVQPLQIGIQQNNNLYCFSPKRFNRFPRFSTFIKGQQELNDPHLQEKIVNLNTAELLGPVEQP